MSSYVLFLTAALLFYIAGLLMIVGSNRPAGVAFIGLGCAYFAIALNRRKKQK